MKISKETYQRLLKEDSSFYKETKKWHKKFGKITITRQQKNL